MFGGNLFDPPRQIEKLVLRPIQEEMLNEVRAAFRHSRRLILQAATAAGKTALAAKIIQNAVEKGKRCLFIADRIVLVNQTSKSFDRWGISHGIVQADNPKYFPNRAVQIASAATLVRRHVGQYDVIIQDEAHVIHKGSLKAFDANPDAFILGLTASPYSKALGKIYETHIQPFTVRHLIDKGLLCDYDAYGPSQIDLSKVKTKCGEYDQNGLGKAADKPKLVADIVQTWREKANNKKTIVFSVNVPHSRSLEKEFQRNGISACEINAYLPKEGEGSVRKLIEDFRNDKFKVLISVAIATTGFDVPDVECVILATATKSMIKLTQAIGRSLRLFPGKERAIVLDHGSNLSRLGFPDEYVIDELDDGKKGESKNKKKEKKEKLPKVCPSCDYLKPAGVHVCPACGFVAKHIEPIETEEGELKKLTRKEAKNYSTQEKQSFLAQLNQYAENKGYKKGRAGCFGWALMKYSEKFGCQPSSRMDWKAKEKTGVEVLKYIQHQNVKYAKAKDKLGKQKAVSCPACGCAQTTKLVTGTIECKACGKVVESA